MYREHDIITAVTVGVTNLLTMADNIQQSLQISQSQQLMFKVVIYASKLLSKCFCQLLPTNEQ